MEFNFAKILRLLLIQKLSQQKETNAKPLFIIII